MSDQCDKCGKPITLNIDNPAECQCPDEDHIFDDVEPEVLDRIRSLEARLAECVNALQTAPRPTVICNEPDTHAYDTYRRWWQTRNKALFASK